MAVTQKHLYGWKMEQVLRPVCEEVLGESLTPSSYRFDGLDMRGSYWDCELKARPAFSVKYNKAQDKSTYKKWLMPTCKADKYDENRELIFFYYWEANHELFCIKYDPVAFQKYERGVPWYSNQEHFFIDAEDWISCAEGV